MLGAAPELRAPCHAMLPGGVLMIREFISGSTTGFCLTYTGACLGGMQDVLDTFIQETHEPFVGPD